MGQRHSLNFMEFMTSFRRGQLLAQADEQLEKIVEAMAETGGDGELTIKLPLKFNKGGQIEITPKITSKVPHQPIGMGIYFVDHDSRLSRRDPDQLDIEDEIERRRDEAVN